MFGIPNPQFLLQPWRNLTHFTEELFATLASPEAVEHQGPVTLRAPEGQTALRIERGGPTLPPAQAPLRPRPAPPSSPVSSFEPSARVRDEPARPQPTAQVEPPARVQPLPRPAPPIQVETPIRAQPLPVAPPPLSPPSPIAQPGPVIAQPIPVAPFTPIGPPPIPQPPRPYTPLVVVDGPVAFTGHEPVRFQTPPQVFNPARQEYEPFEIKLPDLPGPPSPFGGGVTVFVGKVVSGEGGTYEVAIYPDGPGGDAGDSVTVTIPMIAEDESLDSDTWLYGIFQFSDSDGNPIYSAQPPVWMP